MNSSTATNDNFIAVTDSLEENVIARAILVSTAFRLRDEDALVETLRQLTSAVVKLEASRKD